MTSIETERDELVSISARAEAWADLFKLPLGRRTWRGATGDFMGSGVGSSLDFQDHRSYVPGDDPRHINWQAYARSGNYTMKLYREEVRPMIDVVIDASNSMFFEETKKRRSLETIYFAIHAVLKSGASGKFHLIKGNQHRFLSDEAIHSHQWVEEAASLPEANSSSPPQLQLAPFRAQSMRILVSDLLFHGNAEPVLQSLVSRKGFGVIFCPFSRQEARPEWSGNYEFVDSEDKSKHPHRVQLNLLERYRAAYARHFEHWKGLGHKYDVGIVRLPAEPDFPTAIRTEGVSAGAIELWS